MTTIEYGDNEIIQFARNKCPEPSRYKDSNYYRVVVRSKMNLPSILMCDEKFKSVATPTIVITFQRKYIAEPGIAYEAWVCERDGKIYF